MTFKINEESIKKYFPVSVRDALVSVLIFLVALTAGIMLFIYSLGIFSAGFVFLLSVFLISRLTNGYLFGLCASVLNAVAYGIMVFEYRFNGVTAYIVNGKIDIIILSICMIAAVIITGTLKSQIRLHSQIKLEAEKEKTRSNLLRAVSHDLRTPLTSILGASSVLYDNYDLLNKEQKLKLIGEVKEDAQWLIRMVENLLSITRIDAEQGAKIEKAPEAVEELISAAVEKFNKRFPSQQVNVKVPSELLIVPMDAILIEQVIINLLENAVLHSKTTAPIDLTVKRKENYAVFRVEDYGAGIEETVLPHIFDGYFTAKYEQDGDSKKNMGIGLSVCNTIIKAHNGKMTARNKTSADKQVTGAVFEFTLPLTLDMITNP